MNFFKDEKKRISEYYHKFYLGAFLFIYFMIIQSDIASQKSSWWDELHEPIPFINFALVVGIIGLILYLNELLFWTKEQGKNVFIIRKYDIIPISKKEIYYSKFKIIVYNSLVFLSGTVIVYFGTLLLNAYFEFDILKNIIDIIKSFLFVTIFIIFILVINLLEDYKTKKRIC